ncbi:YbaY family lipoprotein [Klebsiella aerogenes]
MTQGNQLIFTNDTVHPVLTRGAGPKVDMVLVRVAS